MLAKYSEQLNGARRIMIKKNQINLIQFDQIWERTHTFHLIGSLNIQMVDFRKFKNTFPFRRNRIFPMNLTIASQIGRSNNFISKINQNQ